MTPIAGIVLCGGQSSRMGQPKAKLIVAGESLLARAVRTVSEVADRIVVAAAPQQDLPSLPEGVLVVRDSEPAAGPLAAFAAAMAGIPPEYDWVFAVGCDLPFLSAGVLRLLASRRGKADAIVPRVDDRWHPLAALYRRRMQPLADRLVAAGRRRMLDLIEVVDVDPVTADELRSVDANLWSLRNINTPDDYAAALRDCR